MLVLSRKKNEQIVIAEKIVVSVVDVRGGTVRLGIECPSEIPIHRGEVHRRIMNGETSARSHRSCNRSCEKQMAVHAMTPIES